MRRENCDWKMAAPLLGPLAAIPCGGVVAPTLVRQSAEALNAYAPSSHHHNPHLQFTELLSLPHSLDLREFRLPSYPLITDPGIIMVISVMDPSKLSLNVPWSSSTQYNCGQAMRTPLTTEASPPAPPSSPNPHPPPRPPAKAWLSPAVCSPAS